MKARKQLLLMVIALISMAMPASAIGLEDIRINARFLTDRMYGAQNEAYMSQSAEKWVRGLCFNELGACD